MSLTSCSMRSSAARMFIRSSASRADFGSRRQQLPRQSNDRAATLCGCLAGAAVAQARARLVGRPGPGLGEAGESARGGDHLGGILEVDEVDDLAAGEGPPVDLVLVDDAVRGPHPVAQVEAD